MMKHVRPRFLASRAISRHIYTILIAPKQEDQDTRNREVVLNTLAAATMFMTAVLLMVLMFSYFALHHKDALVSIGICLGTFAFVAVLYSLSRRKLFLLAAWLLLALYLALAIFTVSQWGINTPFGILMFALVIVMAGILLGSRFSFYSAGGTAIILLMLRWAEVHQITHPMTDWASLPPSSGDFIGLCVVFGILALVSGIFNSKMEHSLHRAEMAEIGLTKQKELLELKVEERTRQLQAEQFEKLQQLHRFAEVGQLTTSLLHELANHLTVLTLDIEGIERKERSPSLRHARQSMRHLENMVERVRNQMQGKGHPQPFNVASKITDILKLLQPRASAAHVKLEWQPVEDKQLFRVKGDAARLTQVMANIISNGIDAYTSQNEEDRRVEISIKREAKNIIVSVRDWGRGIPKDEREKIFEPFFSTKESGMGVGLFMARQMIVDNFHGSLKLAGSLKPTEFIITLPGLES